LNSFNLRWAGIGPGGCGVASYRVYFLNDKGRIVRAIELASQTDEEAVEQTRQLVDGQAVELWERARLIGRFDPIH
jgi:hypothetical protein